MSNLEKAQELAEKLRQEPYLTLSNDCIIKSFRLKKQLRALDIPSKVVFCIGTSPAKWFGRWPTILVIHAWCEVEGTRIETSRPLESAGLWEIVPVNIKPVVGIWI